MRAILSVATGSYIGGHDRLRESIARHCKGVAALLWTGVLPPGSPPHSEHPYAFKLFAIEEARRAGVRSLLWLDSDAWINRDPGPLFDRIERDGHWLVRGGDAVGTRCSDSCLAYSGMSREASMDLMLLVGKVYGFDLRHSRTAAFLARWHEYFAAGHFRGAAINSANPEGVQRMYGAGYRGRPEGFVSADPRVLGHCHDETCATFAAKELGLGTVPIGDGFAGRSATTADDPAIFVVSEGR